MSCLTLFHLFSLLPNFLEGGGSRQCKGKEISPCVLDLPSLLQVSELAVKVVSCQQHF